MKIHQNCLRFSHLNHRASILDLHLFYNQLATQYLAFFVIQDYTLKIFRTFDLRVLILGTHICKKK